MQKTVWLTAIMALIPRLGDSSAHPVLAELKEPALAAEDTAIRLEHAHELLGRTAKLPQGFLTRVNMAPAVHALTRRCLKAKNRAQANLIADTIVQESRRNRLDPLFLLAVIQHESGFVSTKLGTHGEIGLMQIRPATGEWIARKYHLPWHGEATLWNPETNIRIGAAYFSFLRESFKSRGPLYVAAYNLGPKKTRENVSRRIYPKEYSAQVMHNFFRFHAQANRFSARYAALDY